jgi:hypothetical protein
MQPGYQQFRAALRWIVDPADGANFTPMLATRRFLIQEVIGDQVVPNVATENEAGLVGLTPQLADRYDPTMSTTASVAITNMPLMNHWVQYQVVAPNVGTGFPGNEFQHASLLRPVSDMNGPTPAGQLGTVRVQTDALVYLFYNNL